MTKRQTSIRAKPRQALAEGERVANNEATDDTQIVFALTRGLMVLDAFRRTDTGLGNMELAERTGLTKPTVSRLTYTLARQGYLLFDPRLREYRLGVKAISLGAVALAMTNVRTTALPFMRDLAGGSHFNVGLGTRDGHQMVYTDACEGDALVSLRLFPGSRVPLATSAMGRAYLAALAAADREALLAELKPRYDDEWPRIRNGVDAAVEELGTHGFCTSIGAWQKDIHGVAVPILPMPGQPVYVLNLGGPAYALPEQTLRERLAPKLVALARTVEALVGTTDDPRRAAD